MALLAKITLLQLICLAQITECYLSHSYNSLISYGGHLNKLRHQKSFSQAIKKDNEKWSSVLQSSRDAAIPQNSFDFSSQKGWDSFYECGTKQKKNSNGGKEDEDNFEYEWHASVSNDMIVEKILRLENQKGKIGSTLFIGCGNSHLPRKFYDACHGKARITCLDYSQPCLDILKSLHSKDCPNMMFVNANVLELSKVFCESSQKFDIIVDKGLLDALMCTENWSSTVKQLIKEIISVIEVNGGTYILISYKLASSTKEFLMDVSSDKLDWIFDEERISNDRVSFSIAKMKVS